MNESQALRAAIAVEDQAVYGYGLAGARLTGRDRARALAALDAHRVRRDLLVAALASTGVAAPAAPAAYVPPSPVLDPGSARALCAALEDACAGAAWDLADAGAAGTRARSLAVRWLTEAAVAAATWRTAATASPALPGRPG